MKHWLARLRRSLLAATASRRGQALVETALVAPVILLFVAGVADVGRAFYYKIVVTNTAREAAHWATLLCDQRCLTSADQGNPPSDADILNYVSTSSSSQEAFAINPALAPSCVVNSLPGSHTVQQLANPLPGCGPNLAAGHSYLYLWPCQTSCSPNRTSLAPGMHWRDIASSEELLTEPSPSEGGLQAVLRTVGGSLYPATADAAAPHGEEITCTVIYYYQPITPFIFAGGSAIYIVGTTTMQATY